MYRQATMFGLFCVLLCTTPVILGSPFLEHEYELNEAIDFDFEDPSILPYESTPTTVDLIETSGYNGESHRIVTHDKYILEVHRVASSKRETKVGKKPVVLIMHGLLASSAAWVLPTPEKSLPFVLADAGYDVWLGNARGTTYCRKHVSMTVKDKEYWSFSWHEIGTEDLPSMIDYILEKTNQRKLFYIGHSQGSTAFFVMASQRPEYQEKVEAMFALAPVAYVSRMFSPVLQILARLSNKIKLLADLIGMYEFAPTSEALKKFAAVACDEKAITQPLCANVLFLIAGYSAEQLNATLAPTMIQHTPAGASTRQLVHYAQLIKSGKFRQYDHGLIGNLKRYKQVRPPAYDLGSIKVPVYLHYSTNDWLAHVRDVNQLYKELGNPKAKIRVPDDKFNHIDFMWGIDARTLVFDKILSFLAQYRH